MIGQAPRADLIDLFAAHAAPETRFVLRGCMDGMQREELATLLPSSPDDTLYARLPDASTAILSKRAVTLRLASTLAKLRADGAHAIVVACTGDFAHVAGDQRVIFPSRVLAAVAHSLLPNGRLGLLVPLAEQGPALAREWQRPGIEVCVEALRPDANADEALAAARRLAVHAPDLVCLNCFSYTPQTKALVQAQLGVPTMLAVTLTARVLAEMLECS